MRHLGKGTLNRYHLYMQEAVFTADDVERQRARAEAVSKFGKRLGYGALGVATLAALVAVITDFGMGSGPIMVIGLVFACAVLPLSIIVAYGARAAAREDAQYLQAQRRIDDQMHELRKDID